MSFHHSLIPHLRRLVGVVQAILGKPVLLASTWDVSMFLSFWFKYGKEWRGYHCMHYSKTHY